MGMNLDTIINIRANATGGEQLQQLSNRIAGVEAVTKKLTASSGILTGALGALAPIASIAGLGALIKGQIEAGDRMFDLSQKTGVSVEMLAKFDKAAKISGTSLDTVAGGIVKLSKAMVAAASSSGMGDKTKEDMKKAEDAIKDGERNQVRLVKDGVDRRIEALEKESEKSLGEIAKRYRKIEQLLTRQFDDQEEKVSRGEERRLGIEQKAIERAYEQREKAIKEDQSLSEKAREEALRLLNDQRETELDSLRYRYQDLAKERRRQAEDEQQKKLDAIQAQRGKEEAAIKDKNAAEQQLIKDSADRQIESIKKIAEESLKALKKNDQADELSGQLEELGLSGKGASEAFKQLGINIKNNDGTLRSADDVILDISNRFKAMPDGIEKTVLATKLFGKAGADLIPMLNLGGDAINKMRVAMTKAFAEKADEYSDKLTILGGKVGGLARGLTVALLPALTDFTDAITKGVEAFTKLPEPVQQAAGAVALFSMALGALKFTGILSGLGMVLGLFKGLAGLQVAATFAGWAGAIGPAVATITAALSGMLAWIGATLVPGLLAFFSGPVGWITLAVAAVVAGAILFREPIMKFIGWLWQQSEPIRNVFVNIGTIIKEAAKLWLEGIYTIFFKPYVNLFQMIVDLTKSVMSAAWSSIDQSFIQPLIAVWESLKEPIGKFFEVVAPIVEAGFAQLFNIFSSSWVLPFVSSWAEPFTKPISKFFENIGKMFTTKWGEIKKAFEDKFISPIKDIWLALSASPEEFAKKAEESFLNLRKNIVALFMDMGNVVKAPFQEIISGLFASIQSFITGNRNAINGAIMNYNKLAEAMNKIPAPLRFNTPNLPIIPLFSAVEQAVPAMARGGWVNTPTLAQIGDTGRAGGEYAIPAEMMPAAMAAWNQGARGDALVAAMRSGGLAPGSSLAGSPGAGGGRAQLNLTLQTGPVLQQPDGSQWVQREELLAVAEAVLAAQHELNSSSAVRSASGWGQA